MAYPIAAVMIAAIYFGFPPVPVTVAGTFTAIALSYWVSRHPALLRLGASFTGYTFTHVLLSNLDADVLTAASNAGKAVMGFGASEKVMVVVAILVMLAAVMVGTRKGDSLAELIKKSRGQQR